jgi:hypothetical protein
MNILSCVVLISWISPKKNRINVEEISIFEIFLALFHKQIVAKSINSNLANPAITIKAIGTLLKLTDLRFYADENH